MTTKPTSSRRKFLATLGAGGAAAATIALNRQAAEPKSEVAAPQGKGYQVTEHVRNYYRTAKV
jgi:hypothetical protein